MEPNPKHQQHDPNFGKLHGEADIGHEPRRSRAHHDSRNKVPDEWGDPQPSSNKSHNHGESQPNGNSGY
jgi:hypothetical protein